MNSETLPDHKLVTHIIILELAQTVREHARRNAFIHWNKAIDIS